MLWVRAKLEQCLQVREQVEHISKSMDQHDYRLKLLEYKSVDLEARSRRKNLIFGGHSEEGSEDCSRKIATFLSQKLDIQQNVVIDKAHRLGRFKPGRNRAIIVAFRDFSDIQLVLSRAYTLRNSVFNINRDYPQEITNARKLSGLNTKA